VQKCKSAGGLCQSEKVKQSSESGEQITEFALKGGAWLRRALHRSSARQSLSPTELARRRTPRAARGAAPTRGKEGQHVVLSLPRRPIGRICLHHQTPIWHVREDGAIREDRVTNPGEVRVRLETRRQAGRRVNRETVEVGHDEGGDRGWGKGGSGKGLGVG